MIAKNLQRFAEYMNEPAWSISPLSLLVTRYPPTLSHFSTIHPLFLIACIRNRHLAPALPLLSTSIEHIDIALSDLNYNDALQYYYASGVALAMLERWQEAMDSFEIVLGAPGSAPAAIQLEALKKLILVGLVKNGQVISWSFYVNEPRS
jgi:COP9 signalosome complex subunit 3